MQKYFTAPKKLLKVMKICVIHGMLVMIMAGMAMAHDMNGQLLEKKIKVNIVDVSLEDALKQLEEASGVRFFYSIDQLAVGQNVSVFADDQRLGAVLEKLFAPYRINYKVFEKEMTIVLKRVGTEPQRIEPKEVTKGSELTKHRITGVVKDKKTGQALAGVNVIVKGTTNGTATDPQGSFTVDAEDTDFLIFSFIGFTPQEVSVNARAIVDIMLEEEIASLNEVVVNAGYWKVKEKEETGNISRITAADIQTQPISNPLAAMIGRMPGVYVQQGSGLPGASFSIQIRGQNSLRADGNDPLYIIDGVPFTATSLRTDGVVSANGATNPLNSINPNDIESIEVLKDGDATAIYGSRGSNGVVLITTKKGTAGKTKFEVNVYQGAGTVTRMMNLLNSSQYLEMRREALRNNHSTPNPNRDRDLMVWDTTRYTNWQKVLIGGTAHTTSAQTSVSGGNANTQFLIGGGYYRETTVFPGGFAYQKGSAHINLNHLSDNRKLRVNFTANYVSDINNLLQTDFTALANTLAPVAPALYQADGSLNWEKSTWTNPLRELARKYKGQTQNLITNAVVSYEVIPGLLVKANLGYNNIQLADVAITPSSSFDPAGPLPGSSSFGNSSDKKWIVEPQLDYQKQILSGRLSALAGATFLSDVRQATSLTGSNYTSDALLENIAGAGLITVSSSTYTQYKYNAIFARLNYKWRDKYIVNATARRDGSSRFGPGNQFANFGAVGAAWIFTNESFFQHQKILSLGKLRASYGVTGSDQIPDYGYLSTYVTSPFPYNNVSGLLPARAANKNYGWETNRKLEAGVDLGFWNNKINIAASVYRNPASNQLVGYNLPDFTGFSSVQNNLPATVENKGMELVMTTTNVQRAAFSWTTSLNFTAPVNTLISYPNIEASTYASMYKVGKSLGILNLYHSTGVDPTKGTYTFQDVNGDGSINSLDRQFLKKIAKQYYGGLQNSVTYKSWQLTFLFQFVRQTGKNYLLSFGTRPGTGFSNQPDLVLKRWQREGDQAPIQAFTQSGLPTPYNNYKNSDASVGDASFIRLKNLSLSWNIPSAVTNRIKMNTGRVYFQGQNLLTFTKYVGRDPENQVVGTLPPLKVLSVGFQCTF